MDFLKPKRIIYFLSSRRRLTRLTCDWSSDVCSSDLGAGLAANQAGAFVLHGWAQERVVGRQLPSMSAGLQRQGVEQGLEGGNVLLRHRRFEFFAVMPRQREGALDLLLACVEQGEFLAQRCPVAVCEKAQPVVQQRFDLCRRVALSSEGKVEIQQRLSGEMVEHGGLHS